MIWFSQLNVFRWTIDPFYLIEIQYIGIENRQWLMKKIRQCFWLTIAVVDLWNKTPDSKCIRWLIIAVLAISSLGYKDSLSLYFPTKYGIIAWLSHRMKSSSTNIGTVCSGLSWKKFKKYSRTDGSDTKFKNGFHRLGGRFLFENQPILHIEVTQFYCTHFSTVGS